MRWASVDKYHLRAGEWTIARYKVADAVRFILWQGSTLINVFDDAESAKWEAEKGVKCARA